MAPPLAAFDRGIFVVTAIDQSKLSLHLHAEGQDAEKVKQIVEMSRGGVAHGLESAHIAAKDFGPPMSAVVQPAIDFLESIKFEQDGRKVTATAAMDSLGVISAFLTARC